MPAKSTVTKKRGKAKMKVAEKRKQLMDKMKNNLDFKVAIIQELIPLLIIAIINERMYILVKLTNCDFPS